MYVYAHCIRNLMIDCVGDGLLAVLPLICFDMCACPKSEIPLPVVLPYQNSQFCHKFRFGPCYSSLLSLNCRGIGVWDKHTENWLYSDHADCCSNSHPMDLSSSSSSSSSSYLKNGCGS